MAAPASVEDVDEDLDVLQTTEDMSSSFWDSWFKEEPNDSCLPSLVRLAVDLAGLL